MAADIHTPTGLSAMRQRWLPLIVAVSCTLVAALAVSDGGLAQVASPPPPSPSSGPGLGSAEPRVPISPPPSPAVQSPLPAAISAKDVFPQALPKRPEEARAAKTYAVFENHCARCHQTGRTDRLMASGRVSNILDIDAIARDSVLVRPGLPDASRLYDILATRHQPLDVYADATFDQQTGLALEPRPDEIEAVREWIADLGSVAQTCHAREPVLPAAHASLMREAQIIEREGAGDLRFISLAPLYNACASDAEMTAFRHALTRLFNSLSWSPEPVVLSPLDPAGTLFSFKLSDLAWVAGDWEDALSGLPASLEPPIDRDVVARSGSQHVVVRGDWLASAMSDPALYYRLLRLPPSLGELAQASGVDLDQSVRSGSVRRAILTESGVTRGHRLVERHAGALGGFWLVYDFTTVSGQQDLLSFPLGPKRTPSTAQPFQADQIRVLFTLPNGFLANALFDGRGQRLERVVPGVEKAYTGDEISRAEPGTGAGLNCLSCHSDGVITVRDAFAKVMALGPQQLSAAVQREALQLAARDSELGLLIAGDNERYRNAQAAVGVDPALRVNGEDSLVALAQWYRRPLVFQTAIAETMLPKDAFVARLASADQSAAALARRLQHGVLPRGDAERLFASLAGARGTNRIVPRAQGFLRDEPTAIGLSMWLDRARPAKGDLITIRLQSDTDCNLTLISVDAEGQATVLLPNEFEPENRLTAGQMLSVPGEAAIYQLRFKSDTAETLVARCSLSQQPPAGIEHDFERQKFTVLGNWENFIRDTLETESDLRANPQKAIQARAVRAAAERRGGRTSRISITARDLAQARAELRVQEPTTRALSDGRAVLVVGE